MIDNCADKHQESRQTQSGECDTFSLLTRLIGFNLQLTFREYDGFGKPAVTGCLWVRVTIFEPLRDGHGGLLTGFAITV